MADIYTTDTGEVVQVSRGFPSFRSAHRPKSEVSHDGAGSAHSLRDSPHRPVFSHDNSHGCQSPLSPLVTVTNANDSPPIIAESPDIGSPLPTCGGSSGGGAWSAGHHRSTELPKFWMAYNEYGELVDIDKAVCPPNLCSPTVKETLRLVEKAYHHEIKDKVRAVIVPQVFRFLSTFASATDEDEEEKPQPSRVGMSSLSSWIFTSPRPSSSSDVSGAQKIQSTPPHKSQPPRVLEIGCGSGFWCFSMKEEHPEWTIEGLDDQDRWNKHAHDRCFRDFMEPNRPERFGGYFEATESKQTLPDFTVRNLNSLLNHPYPIAENRYSLIRGRDVFAKVESYKTFLDDVRRILQPDGVVEFSEIDPRPRVLLSAAASKRRSPGGGSSGGGGGDDGGESHTSRPETGWTDRIADRFREPLDSSLAGSGNSGNSGVPGWSRRIAERLGAKLRPSDGIAAVNLKAWLEGIGFWDVKQLVFKLPIGGPTEPGMLLRDILLEEIEVENSIPVIAQTLPPIEIADLRSDRFHINLHIVTGRKPEGARFGDVLADGRRQAAPGSLLHGGARISSRSGSHWERFDPDSELTTLMASVKAFAGEEAGARTASRAASGTGGSSGLAVPREPRLLSLGRWDALGMAAASGR